MANERITEGIVRDVLRDYGYYLPGNGISVEEQKSEIQSVKSLLSKAGKAAKGGQAILNLLFPRKLIRSL